MALTTARIYDLQGAEPRGKFLIDRLWPRGVSKATAPFEAWLKDIAPSPDHPSAAVLREVLSAH